MFRLMAIFRLTDWQQICKQLYFGMRLVYGGGGLELGGGTRSRVCWVGKVMWVHGYYCAVLSLYSLHLWCWINLKMAIRAETFIWYLCNKQHISNRQIVVFDSWLIQLYFIKTQRGWRTIWLWLNTPKTTKNAYSFTNYVIFYNKESDRFYNAMTHCSTISLVILYIKDTIPSDPQNEKQS